MTVYEMIGRRKHLFQAYCVLFLGLFIFVSPALFLSGVILIDGKKMFDTIGLWGTLLNVGFLMGVGSLIGLVGWTRLNLVPYEIYLFDNGMVEFKRWLDSLTMNATEIHVIRKLQWSSDEGDYRELKIQHLYGSEITIRDIYWLDEFVAQLLSLNPAIIVEGAWTT